MKLTERKLRSIIREELSKLTEISSDEIEDMKRRLRHDLTKHPAVEEVGKSRGGTIEAVADGRTFSVYFKDKDPVDRPPRPAEPENWKVTVREEGVKGLGGFVNSRSLGQAFDYKEMKNFVEDSIEMATRR